MHNRLARTSFLLVGSVTWILTEASVMTALKCLAAAAALAFSVHGAIACPGYGEYTMAEANAAASTAQSQAPQPAPVQQSIAPAASTSTDVASAVAAPASQSPVQR
jgi:hypothetical protein